MQLPLATVVIPKYALAWFNEWVATIVGCVELWMHSIAAVLTVSPPAVLVKPPVQLPQSSATRM